MIAFIVIGVVLIVAGAFIMWTGTSGVQWNSTHGRSLQKRPHVSDRQQTYNTVVARIAGPLGVILGVILIIVGARR